MSALHQHSHPTREQQRPANVEQLPHPDHHSLPESIGKRVDPAYSKTLHARVKDILQIQHNCFPGTEPVSFEAKHLKNIEREDYYVCEKTDGVRYLLFFVHSPKGPASFLFDKNRAWHFIPNLVFPVRGREKEWLKDTLMDGELVVDTKENDKKCLRFLAFDLMALNGVSVTQRSANSRLGMLQQDIVQPFHASLSRLTDRSKSPPFTIELKKMERAYGLHLVFDQMTKLKHGGEGVIWTPVKWPYTPGTCDKLLKWKPPESNTVEFRISAQWSKEHKPIYTLETLTKTLTYKFYDHFQPEPQIAAEWKKNLPHGRIAEFRYVPDLKVTIVEQGYAPTTRKGGWQFVRFRDDKEMADTEEMVQKTWKSIQDGVTKDQLLARMDRVRAAWKAREKGLPMPPFISTEISSVQSESESAPPLPTPALPSPATSSTAGDLNSKGAGTSLGRRDSATDTLQNVDRRRSEADVTLVRKTDVIHGPTQAHESWLTETAAPEESRKNDVNTMENAASLRRSSTTSNDIAGLVSKREYRSNIPERKRFKSWTGEEHKLLSRNELTSNKSHEKKLTTAMEETATDLEVMETGETADNVLKTDKNLIDTNQETKVRASEATPLATVVAEKPSPQRSHPYAARPTPVESQSMPTRELTRRRRGSSPTSLSLAPGFTGQHDGQSKSPMPHKTAKMRRLVDFAPTKHKKAAKLGNDPETKVSSPVFEPDPVNTSTSTPLLRNAPKREKAAPTIRAKPPSLADTPHSSNNLQNLLTTSVEPSSMWNASATLSFHQPTQETHPYHVATSTLLERKHHQPHDFAAILHTQDTPSKLKARDDATMTQGTDSMQHTKAYAVRPNEPLPSEHQPTGPFINHHATHDNQFNMHNNGVMAKTHGMGELPPPGTEHIHHLDKNAAEKTRNTAAWRASVNASLPPTAPDNYERTRQQPRLLSPRPPEARAPTTASNRYPDDTYYSGTPAAAHPHYHPAQHPSYPQHMPYATPSYPSQPATRSLQQPSHVPGATQIYTDPSSPNDMPPVFQHHHPPRHDPHSKDGYSMTHTYPPDYAFHSGFAARHPGVVPEHHPRQDPKPKRNNKSALDFILN